MVQGITFHDAYNLCTLLTAKYPKYDNNITLTRKDQTLWKSLISKKSVESAKEMRRYEPKKDYSWQKSNKHTFVIAVPKHLKKWYDDKTTIQELLLSIHAPIKINRQSPVPVAKCSGNRIVVQLWYALYLDLSLRLLYWHLNIYYDAF